MLSASNLSVHIDGRDILKGVDFSARPGEITAIVGPNGSGKSTLLAALSGAQSFSGMVSIGSLSVPDAKPWQLATRRGVLSQFTAVAFPFTVAEIVRLGQLNGASATSEERTDRALTRVGLAGYGARPYHALSGGEQQRVQLARVLTQIWTPVDADGPRWLILDEPVASLDIAHQLAVMTIAQDFAKGGGGVVAVMHDLNLTAMFAASVALLSKGHLLHQGAVDEVFTNDILSAAYGCQVQVNSAPPSTTYILPQAAIA